MLESAKIKKYTESQLPTSVNDMLHLYRLHVFHFLEHYGSTGLIKFENI